MTQENQHAQPESDPGGYGTPTAEQELGGAQAAAGGPGGDNVGTNAKGDAFMANFDVAANPDDVTR